LLQPDTARQPLGPEVFAEGSHLHFTRLNTFSD
jgi:hypothetical protein